MEDDPGGDRRIPGIKVKVEGRDKSVKEQELTFVFERTPLLPSIQTYSAMIDPFWSSFMYLRTWKGIRW